MAEPTAPLADDEARLAALAQRLADGIVAALPGWVARCVAARSAGVVLDDDAVADAGRRSCDHFVQSRHDAQVDRERDTESRYYDGLTELFQQLERRVA